MTTMDNVAAQLESLKMQLGDLESSLRVNSAFQNSQQLNAGAAPISVGTSSRYSVGTELAALGAPFASNLTWYGGVGTGARTCFIPINIPFPLTSGAPTAIYTGGGTIITGIYDRHGTKLIDSSTGQTSMSLQPGLYYMAAFINDGTGVAYSGWTLPVGVAAEFIDVWWQDTGSSLPAQRPNSDVLGLTLTKLPLLTLALGFWHPT